MKIKNILWKSLILIGLNTALTEVKAQPVSLRAVSLSSITAPIKFIQVDSFKIAYKVIGKGKPVVFLQRFRGNLNDWDPAFVDDVAKNYQVILFDAPGIGLSNGMVPTSITTMADQAVQFANALGIRKAAYLGWSMGGAVAQALVINHPDAVSKLVLLATGPSGNPEFVPGSAEFGTRARKPVYEFEDYQYLFFYKSPTAKKACADYLKRVETIKEKDMISGPASVRNQSAAVGDFKQNKEKDYFQQLKTIRQPVLIGNGKYDPSYPLINSYVLAREIPNAKLIIYPDSGHGFLFQHYRAFVPELIAFLGSPDDAK